MGLLVRFCLLLVVLPVFGQPASANQGEPAQRQASASIELHLNASADTAFPLFGPVRESEWAPDWSPVWIYPAEPRQTTAGAVFTTSHHAGVSTWVMTVYDTDRRTVDYVNFIPGHRVTQISITVRPDTAATCVARVSYRVTALSDEGSAFVAHFAKEFLGEGPHWEKAINDSIRKNGLHRGSEHNEIPVKPN
jgi:hypothetical protein